MLPWFKKHKMTYDFNSWEMVPWNGICKSPWRMSLGGGLGKLAWISIRNSRMVWYRWEESIMLPTWSLLTEDLNLGKRFRIQDVYKQTTIRAHYFGDTEGFLLPFLLHIFMSNSEIFAIGSRERSMESLISHCDMFASHSDPLFK